MRKMAALFGMFLIIAALATADVYILTRSESLAMLDRKSVV